VPEYGSWGQVAGYFDGDGTIYFSDTSNQPYKLSLSLVFVDQSYYQLANVKLFLNRRDIRTSNILKRSDGMAYQLAVSEYKSVKKAMRRLLPYLGKKEFEARAALEYYLGRTAGSDVARVFEKEVVAGRRERHPRKVPIDVPYTRPVGDRLMKRIRNDRLRDAFGRYRAKLTPQDFLAIRSGHLEEGKRICDLARENPQYARETIRRVLGRGRGYVGVKGIGRVDTTDTTLRDPRPAVD
jgi:hypothetical protein